MDLILSLTEEEKDWWAKEIRKYRKAKVGTASFYIEKALKKTKISENEIAKNTNSSIKSIRSEAWAHYIADELQFHREVLRFLIKERPKAGEILEDVVNSASNALTKGSLPEVIGDYLGRIMPYIYQLSLSTTNSRRTRSGKTLENIIRIVFKTRSIPFEDQKKLGSGFYKKYSLGKMVDMIIPSGKTFESNRKSAIIVTMKTSLRERWAEVVEEIQRTRIPNIHLITLDPAISKNLIKILADYNITLVVYDEIKKEKLKPYNNVMGFSEFFEKEIPHCLSRV